MSEEQPKYHTVFVRVDKDGDPDPWPRYTCPYPEDSTDCGLCIENKDHDEDGCAYYDDGEDGCDADYGYVKHPGCALSEVAGRMGLSWEDLGLDEEALPKGVEIPVELSWEKRPYDEPTPELKVVAQ